MALDFCRSITYSPGEQLTVTTSYRWTGKALQLHARCYKAFDEGWGNISEYCRAIIVRVFEAVRWVFGCSTWQLGVRGFCERLRYYRTEGLLSDGQLDRLADEALNIALELHVGHTVKDERVAWIASKLQGCFPSVRGLSATSLRSNPIALIDPQVLYESATGLKVRSRAGRLGFVLAPEERERLAPNLRDLSFDLIFFLSGEEPTLQRLTSYWNTILPPSAQMTPEFVAQLRLSPREEESLLCYMMGLTKTQDFSSCSWRVNLALGLYNILVQVGKNEAFREYFFEQIEEALTHCCDRVAAYHALLTGEAKVIGASTIVEKAIVIIGLHRVRLIQEIAAAKGGSETIECFVRYLFHLRGIFRLPIDFCESKYGSLSITIADIEDAKRRIGEETSTPDKILDILIQDDHWRKWLETNNNNIFSAILQVHAEMLEKIEVTTDQEYLAAVERIEKLRSVAMHEAYVNCTITWLTSASRELLAAL